MRRPWLLAIGGAGLLALLISVGLAGWQAAAPPPAPVAPHFVDEAVAAGLVHRYSGESDYFVGGGVAAFDCNADRRPDLYFAGGAEPASLFVNESPTGGALAFARRADAVTDLTAVTGAYPLDFDGDGEVDLAVLRHGENVLLRGLGDCGFERANEAWGFDGGNRWTTAFSATWEVGASWPTIAIGHYLDADSTDRDRLCFDNELIRPAVDGDAFAPSIALDPGWCSLSMLFSDWDRSGRRDLRVSNDRHYYNVNGDGEEQLWRIEAGAPPRLYTENEGWQRLRIWGMGIASADLTDDGYPEYYLTSQSDNKLQVLADGPSQPTYEDMALDRGATAHSPYTGDEALPSTGWHAEFQDVNNDGLLDLFVAKGNVEAMPDYAARDPSNLLLGQPDGTFAEGAEAAGIVSFARARGASVVDLNLDGLLDLVIVTRRENVQAWRNLGTGTAEEPAPMGHWLAVRLLEDAPNRDAIGAWLEVRGGDQMIQREVTVGGGHVSGQLGWIHVGLGSVESAEVRVVWPDGEAGPWLSTEVDRFVIVERGASAAETWDPAED